MSITSELIVLTGRDGLPVKFSGHSLTGEKSTRGEDRPRWVTMEIYKRDDGGYVLYRVGQSLIYHRTGMSCTKSGVSVMWEELPDDAMPCQRCNPPFPDALSDDEPVLKEIPWRSVHLCQTLGKVEQVLIDTAPHDSTGERPNRLSSVASSLLLEAAQADAVA
jgi:hypothetical protein